MDRREHWERVYVAKADGELSWFQSAPGVSLELIQGVVPPARSVIDVGGGQSALAAGLLAMGVERVTVLDIAPSALRRGRERLGAAAERVRWVEGDVLEARGLGPADVWHDRAVFHFLTEAADRRLYAAAVRDALRPGGHAVIATFAPSGPERCSGLAVRRYDAAGIAAEFGAEFELVNSATETHTTPWGKAQEFAYAVLRRGAPVD